MPNAKPLSGSEQRARRTKRPALFPALHVSSRIAVLPMPARPSTIKTPPRRTKARAVASSDSRSRSLFTSAMVAWGAPDCNVSSVSSFHPSTLILGPKLDGGFGGNSCRSGRGGDSDDRGLKFEGSSGPITQAIAEEQPRANLETYMRRRKPATRSLRRLCWHPRFITEVVRPTGRRGALPLR
jgi:hypothetical protein